MAKEYCSPTSYSLSKKSLPGTGSESPYKSSKVLGKVGSGERRAPQYKLENLKK